MEEKKRAYLFSQLNPDNYELILWPTEQCNFRCTYCYEDFEIGKMPNDVIVGVKTLIENVIPKIKKLRICWFGGEPLLAKLIIDDISNHAIALSSKYGVSYSSQITTNGYLLEPAMLESLLKLKVVDYQISLDGDEVGHNKTRLLANGQGSYKKIVENLLFAKGLTYQFKILLRIHVTQSNYDSIRNLLDFLKVNLLDDERFSIFIKPIGNWGGPNSKAIGESIALPKDFDVEKLRQDLYEYAGVIKRRSEKSSVSYMPNICYAAKPNSYSIRADGRVQKCTLAVNSDSNTIGKLSRDGLLSIDNEKLKKWVRGFEYGDIDMLGCPLSNFPKDVVKNTENMIAVENI